MGILLPEAGGKSLQSAQGPAGNVSLGDDRQMSGISMPLEGQRHSKPCAGGVLFYLERNQDKMFDFSNMV